MGGTVLTRLEATDLATRILETFHGPPGHAWEEELATLDAGTAGTAFARCRREHKSRWLSIAEFIAVYRSLRTDDPTTRGPVCIHCDGTGWVQAEDHLEHPGTDHERRYTQNEPCTCNEGQARRRSTVWRERAT